MRRFSSFVFAAIYIRGIISLQFVYTRRRNWTRNVDLQHMYACPRSEHYESPHSRAPAFHRYSPESRAQTRLWNQDREVLRVESGSRMFWAAKCEIEFGPQLARKCGFGVSHENLIFLLEHP